MILLFSSYVFFLAKKTSWYELSCC
jgi:hypothetical protein